MLKFWRKGSAANPNEHGLPEAVRRSEDKLKLIMHVGPHKTGTTSLQRALLAEYGTEKPRRIWYPAPLDRGPGHAKAAQAVIGRNKEQPELHSAVQEMVEQARESGCEVLILSSENFATAYRRNINNLVSQTSDTDLHLIVTLSPLGRRAVSLWQERVKHREHAPLPQAKDVVFAGASLAPNLPRYFATHFSSAKMSVIITNPSAPEDLYANFSKATGIQLPPPSSPEGLIRNRGLGFVEAEVVRGFNSGLAATDLTIDQYRKGRFLLEDLFQSEQWRKAVPRVPLAVPREWLEPLTELCTETISQLRELESQGRIEIFGDPQTLNDLTEVPTL